MTTHDTDTEKLEIEKLAAKKSGFVSVLGLPNAGKSTLVNTIVGAKVSIVSPKVQTTRTRVLGMAIHGQTQIILIDTPGIFKPKKTLEKAMVTAALASFEGTDYIIHIVDAAQRGALEENQMIISSLQGQKNVILVLNKIDRVEKPVLLDRAQAFNEKFPYLSTFMISALSAKGTQDLANYLAQIMPVADWPYPEDQMSDMPMRLMAAEITREKIFLQLHQEIPYAVFVETESWEEFDNGSVKISQVITVQRDSQKAIILGKGGDRIKKIGQSARIELEDIIGRPVHIKLFVRVQENWAERAENYSMYGLDIPR